MNDYLLIDNYNNSKLIKMNFSNFSKNCILWNYNRKINDTKINELYDILINNNYKYPWTIHAILDKKNQIQIIDGQHRYTAILNYINNFYQYKECNHLYIWIWIYELDDENEIINLFKNINNNMPIDINELPDIKIFNLIKIIKDDPILKNGIGIKPNTHICHSPFLHEKELNLLLLKYNKYISNISNEEFLFKLKEMNNLIRYKSIDELYGNKKINFNVIDKSLNLNFFLGLKDSKYNPDKWIKLLLGID